MALLSTQVAWLRTALPRGRTLSDDLWLSRHRVLLGLLVVHSLVMPLVALLGGHPVAHGVHGTVVLAVLALGAALSSSRALGSASVALGLVVASALVVHTGGGHTFLHFHFFVVVAILALYQDWLPFLLALGFVVLDHAILGLVSPHEVYSDPWSQANPVLAAAVHGGYVLAAATASVVTWGWSEREHAAAGQRTELAASLVRDSERRLAEILDNAPHMVYVKDLDGRLTRMNPRFVEVNGGDHDTLVGKTSADLLGDAYDPLSPQELEVLRTGRASEDEVELELATGTRTVQIVRFPLLDEDGRAYALAAIGTDTTRRAAAERDLVHQSRHDALTGLPNRTELYARLEAGLAGPVPVGCVFLDLDGFKEVNDSLGHDVGDELLRVVAGRLRAVSRPDENLSRLGGDEFVLCLTESGGVAAAEQAAERLLRALSEPVVLAERVVEISGSCGVAVGRGSDGVTPGMLLRDADTALYEAKDAGRNRSVTFVPALRDRDERRRRLQSDLADALRTGTGLVLQYQPIADAATGSIVIAEALVRWQHPVDGLLPPDAFLGLAADRGLLPALDHWVVGQACAQAAEWQRAGLDLSVSINVTPGSVADGSIVGWVREACAKTGLAPTRIVVELTETAVVDHPAETSAALAQLRLLGVRVALDDFGTGFSSMSLLRDLPVDIVKIDRSFTAGSVRNTREAAIVQATAMLAAALGATTIAEGVEDERELAAVRAAGCEMVQGWHIAKALDPSALVLMLAAGLTPAVPTQRVPTPVLRAIRPA